MQQTGEKYTKHDYAIFNPIHTWVEYINRLLRISRICVITFGLSLDIGRKIKNHLANFLNMCLNGFQAWLGKTVVDSVLNPFKIQHMLAALLMLRYN
jgi:cytochrome c oxidase assembly protein subunit 15